MWTVTRQANNLRSIHLIVCWMFLICFIINACQAQPSTPQVMVTWTPPVVPLINPSDSQTPKPAPSLTCSPSPTLIGPQVVLNSGFDDGLQGWDVPYGDLKHTATEYHTGPGAARLATDSATGFLDYQGNAGQCIELENVIKLWPEFEGQLFMTLEAYFRTDPEITKVSLNGIFLTEPGCRTGQAGYFDLPTLEGNQPWTRLGGTTLIPAEAVSFHVFVNAYGTSDNATVYIDDIRAYPSPPPPD